MKKGDKTTLMPKLRFPEFLSKGTWRETIVGEISNTVIAGGTPSTSDKKFWGGNVRWMNSGELNYKKVYEVQGRITREGLVNSSTKLIPPRCVLIGLAGQGKTRGTIAMNMIELCTNQSIAAIFPNDPVFNSDFLYYELDRRYDELRRLSAGGEGRGGLNLQIIKSLKVTLPALPEQQKIADCLNSVDNLIATETRKLDALKTHKKWLMRQLFPREGETQPSLRFPKFQSTREWEEKEVGDVFKVTRGEVLSMTLVKDEETDDARYPVYSSQTKRDGLSGFYSSYLYENAITWTTDGANAGDVNYRVGKFYCTNVCGVLINTNGYANPCIAALLNSVSRRHVSYVGNPKLMNGVMAQIKIPFPTIEEQLVISDFLSSIKVLISAQTKKLDLLKTHKQGLMQQIFPSPEEA